VRTSSVKLDRHATVGPVWARGVAVVVVAAAGVIAAAGLSPSHVLAMRTADGWFPWLEFLSTDGLLAGCAVVLIAGRTRIWTAWATVLVSIPANLAAMAATANPLLAWVVALWPTVAVALGAMTFVRCLPRPTEYQEEHR
jgi:hypothetical protein